MSDRNTETFLRDDAKHSGWLCPECETENETGTRVCAACGWQRSKRSSAPKAYTDAGTGEANLPFPADDSARQWPVGSDEPDKEQTGGMQKTSKQPPNWPLILTPPLLLLMFGLLYGLFGFNIYSIHSDVVIYSFVAAFVIHITKTQTVGARIISWGFSSVVVAGLFLLRPDFMGWLIHMETSLIFYWVAAGVFKVCFRNPKAATIIASIICGIANPVFLLSMPWAIKVGA